MGGAAVGNGYRVVKRWETEWQDDVDVLALPKGVQVKVLHDDRERKELDLLVHFPPGYYEPPHNHASSHGTIVLEGTQIVGGVHLQPGDYGYGPADKVHGPFDYPEGCVVFSCVHGDSHHHIIAPAAGQYYTVKRWETEWQADTDVLTLPPGIEVKVLRDDRENKRLDLLVHFPPGYHEPAHTHASSHGTIVLEGCQIVGGVHLHPGDYGYGPADEEHGPFDYPEGCVVYASFHGDSAKHVAVDPGA